MANNRIGVWNMMGLVLILLTGILLLGCTVPRHGPNDSSPSDNHLPNQFDMNLTCTECVDHVVRGNNEFAVNMYHLLANQSSDNILFSPYSISEDLAMLYEGAGGSSARELEDVFGYSHEETPPGYYTWRNSLSDRWVITDSLWVDKRFKLSEDYASKIERYYDGVVNPVDFRYDPEGARETINNWVSLKTNNKINNLLPQRSVDSSTVLVLVNTVYFNDDWLYRFNHVYNSTFHTIDGREIETNMMSVRESFDYYEDEDVQVVSLPYKDGRTSMLVILPKGDLRGLEEDISVDRITYWMDHMNKTEVLVEIPKFTMDQTYDLKPILMELGVHDIFDPSVADLSGLSSGGDDHYKLFVSFVVHKSYIDVNENGTEAAAATATGVEFTAIPDQNYKVFRANRPFIYMIVDGETNGILFMGRMTSPP